MLDNLIANMLTLIYTVGVYVVFMLILYRTRCFGFLKNTTFQSMFILGLAVLFLTAKLGVGIINRFVNAGTATEAAVNNTLLTMFSNPDPKTVIIVIAVLGTISQVTIMRKRRQANKQANQQAPTTQTPAEAQPAQSTIDAVSQLDKEVAQDATDGNTSGPIDNTNW